ncbi:unnamed protein product [Lampetra fluviatilis]
MLSHLIKRPCLHTQEPTRASPSSGVPTFRRSVSRELSDIWRRPHSMRGNDNSESLPVGASSPGVSVAASATPGVPATGGLHRADPNKHVQSVHGGNPDKASAFECRNPLR